MIEDYSIKLQFQEKRVIMLLPVLEEDHCFYTACVIDLE